MSSEKRHSIELLSPAGDLECGIAAFTYGADAVYLGMQDFSARADAGNFTFDELNTLLGIAHRDTAHPRKVYVAVNTLIRERELPPLIELLATLRDMGTDGLIIQDWAVFQLAREHFPELELHASTQLAIHNLAGAERARELGFSRVVLARELSMPEIERIAALPDLETEVFIHGALCYCYSGLCLLSAALRGTSGNRGSCEYICRANYVVKNNGKPAVNANIMSMKDLATGDLLAAFRNAGVASLKIEGRKKTPLYVSAVTNYYRRLLDGTFKPGEQTRAEADIRTIFSRPWTPFHYKRRKQLGITDIHTVGHRGTDVGIVTNIVTDDSDRLRFTVKNQPLEKHDGLQVELSDRDKPFGFPVNDIRLFPQRNNDTWKNAFVAPVDATVEVTLPDGHPQIPVGSRIFCASSQAVKRSYSWETPRPALVKARIPLDIRVKLEEQSLTATAQAVVGSRTSDSVTETMALESPLSPAKQPEKVAESIRNSFSKLGDTEYELGELAIDNPSGLFAPASMLNELRRRIAEAMDESLADNRRQTIHEITACASKWMPSDNKSASPTQWRIGIDKPFFLNLFTSKELDNIFEVVFYIGRTTEDALLSSLDELTRLVGDRDRIRIGLPPVMRGDCGCVTDNGIATLLNAGFRRWELNNIGSRQLLLDAGAALESLDTTAGWQLFTTNRIAAKALLSQGFSRLMLSPDDTFDNWRELLQTLSTVIEVPVYQDTVLGISDVCAMSSLNEHCPGKAACTFTSLKLANPHKGENLLAVNNNCQTILLNEKPLNLAGHLRELKSLGARHFRADFLWQNYAPTTVLNTWHALHADTPSPDAWTANLFR